MNTDDEKRLAEIRDRYQSPKAVHVLAAFSDDPAVKDVLWLLDKFAERDARIEKLEEALREIIARGKGLRPTRPPNPWEEDEIAEEALK